MRMARAQPLAGGAAKLCPEWTIGGGGQGRNRTGCEGDFPVLAPVAESGSLALLGLGLFGGYARPAGSTRVSELAADVGPEHRAIVCQRHEQEQAFLESCSQRHAPRE
jgi:hypothetical protein